MAVVYQHRRKDTNEVFYIGIGKSTKRVNCKRHRNSHWEAVVAKYGYEADVLIDGLSWQDACEVEAGMIEAYGRSDKGLGCLVNQTDGGDGAFGVVVKEETKEKIRIFQLSLNKKGKPGRVQSEETKEKIRNTLKGTTRPQEVIEKMRGKRKNKRTSPPQKKVECPHCNKIGGINSMKQHHFDNCEVIKPREVIKCPYCEIKSKSLNVMKRHHFDNCKNKI